MLKKLKLRNYELGPIPKRKQAVVIMHTDALKCTEKAKQREQQFPIHPTNRFRMLPFSGQALLAVERVCMYGLGGLRCVFESKTYYSLNADKLLSSSSVSWRYYYCFHILV